MAPRDRRPQPHALPADGCAHARRLRALPRGRAVHRHAEGLQLLPSVELPGTTNPNHQAAGFPITCESCHTTSAWRPANWDHDGRYFPIYSGKHRGKWSSCTDCHVTAGNYRAFECILCHEHSNRTEVDNKHRGEAGYAYQSAACYRCHPRGTH